MVISIGIIKSELPNIAWYGILSILQPVFVKLREGMVRPTRSLVTITLPVYSLQECAMQAIQRTLHKPDDAYKLEIPVGLQKELHHRCGLTARIRRPTTVTQ